ncbi:MAG: flavin reductase family protein [Clostridia bacterium]|nr:flavin reductase family protein [Clostridia bacterium]MBP3650975.1 flavin reductase family protein [Clostridia bacterium]
MEKNVNFRSIGPTTYLSPVPVVMLGCADPENNIAPNLITVAWAGVVCSKPPMISVSIRKERYSHGIIKNTGEFTLNLTSQALCRATDFCGVKSGREVDKFAAMELTPIPTPGLNVAPAVAQAPAFLSCKVKDIIELGSHDLFLAEVVDVNIAEEYFTESGSINEEAMELVGYVHGKYRAMSDVLGFFGYSIASDEALERRGLKR